MLQRMNRRMPIGLVPTASHQVHAYKAQNKAGIKATNRGWIESSACRIEAGGMSRTRRFSDSASVLSLSCSLTSCLCLRHIASSLPTRPSSCPQPSTSQKLASDDEMRTSNPPNGPPEAPGVPSLADIVAACGAGVSKSRLAKGLGLPQCPNPRSYCQVYDSFRVLKT